ncbi:HAMP domain-containing protein [Actinoplanes aureus]|uniref:Methyl-accepting chemotaxis protein n=1 Tax=Actinoplanes aureus TaxID=2792083 RepID=A0A931C0G3_9ACTN|nr:methyl-accepting chemotaxis protein [Actinoplanes aureus]MBG0561005.1 methyl-accepting chemotaxis protein [Actinoplanes aureus]
MQNYRALRDTIIFRKPMAAGYEMPAPDQILPEFNRVETAMNGAMDELQSAEEADADAMAVHGNDSYEQARLVTLLGLIIGFVLAAFIGFGVMRLIKRQLATVSTALSAVADGDLTVSAEVRSRHELGQMAEATNRARDGLVTSVRQLSHGAEERAT